MATVTWVCAMIYLGDVRASSRQAIRRTAVLSAHRPNGILLALDGVGLSGRLRADTHSREARCQPSVGLRALARRDPSGDGSRSSLSGPSMRQPFSSGARDAARECRSWIRGEANALPARSSVRRCEHLCGSQRRSALQTLSTRRHGSTARSAKPVPPWAPSHTREPVQVTGNGWARALPNVPKGAGLSSCRGPSAQDTLRSGAPKNTREHYRKRNLSRLPSRIDEASL